MRNVILAFFGLVFLFFGCLGDLSQSASTETTNGTGGATGKLVMPDGRPAAGASIKIYRASYIPSFTDINPITTTNSRGEYSLSTNTIGVFNLLAEHSDGKKAFIDSIAINDSTDISIPTDTVKPPGGIIGKSYMPGQSDTNQVRVTIYMPGTGFITLPDIGGSFSLPRIPEGDYRIFFNPTNLDYFVKIVEVHVTSGATLDLGTIILYGKEVTGIPIAIAGNNDTVSINDTIRLHGIGYDPLGFNVQKEWDVGNKGTFAETKTGDTSFAAPDVPEDMICLFRVIDSDENIVTDTVVITVLKDAPTVSLPRDTVFDYSADVSFPIKIEQRFGTMDVEIDTANNGAFTLMASNITAKDTVIFAGFFTSSAEWDSVKVRVTDDDGNVVIKAYKVDIRPRPLEITSIDSTTNSITIHYSKTLEPDFTEYRIYRKKTNAVDNTSELWAVIADSGITGFTGASSYAWKPYYYRVYQVDREGALSRGGAAVYGCIINTPPSSPAIRYPANDQDTIWSDDTLRWSPSLDSNGHAVRYDISINYNDTGYAVFQTGINDTFVKLRGFDSLNAKVKIIARDSLGTAGAWSVERSFAIKWGGPKGMKLVPAGSFVDGNGNTAILSKSFWMDSTEVTGKEYLRLMGGKHPEWARQYFSGDEITGEDRPAENIGFFAAIIFCNEKSKSVGLDTVYSFGETPQYDLVCHWDRIGYRLPTEDEWELAAQGGMQFQYGTDDGTISCEKVNYNECQINRTVNVAVYPPNQFGLYDMSGNAAELCWDVFNQDGCQLDCDNRIDGRIDYCGATQNEFFYRVLKGGSWNKNYLSQQIGIRDKFGSGYSIEFNGVRTILQTK